MAWNDAPPTAEELKATSWASAPPSEEELKAAGVKPPDNPHDLGPFVKEAAGGLWDSAKNAALHPIDTASRWTQNAKAAFVPADFGDKAGKKISDAEFEDAKQKMSNDAPIMPGLAAGAAFTGSSAADTYIRSRKAGNDNETAMKDARNAAVFQGGIVGVGAAVGPVMKQAGRLLPATEGSVTNGVAAKLGGLMPGGSTAEDINAVYSNPELRQQARGFNATAAAEDLKPQVTKARSQLEDAVGGRFGELEGESLKLSDPADVDAAGQVRAKVAATNEKVEANPKFYKPLTKEVLNQVQATLDSGGPEEHGTESFGKPLDEATAQSRTLRARKNLDDVMRSKDWEKLRMHDRDAIQGVRDTLDDSLKEGMSGAPLRQQADSLYSDYKTAGDNAFKPLNGKAPSGDTIPDTAKIESNLKSQNGRGANFDDRMEGLQKFIQDHNAELGGIPEVRSALDSIKNSREVAEMAGQLGNLNRAGGPTGIAVHTATHLGLAAANPATIPLQLMLMPITDPGMYAKLVDTLSPATRKAVQAGAAAMMQSPAIANSLVKLRVQNSAGDQSQ